MAEVAAPSHPRDAFALEGQDAQERAFLDALDRGRLHHAWLLTGPEGVGKATFAFRAARRLLGAAPDPNLGLLGARMTDPVVRQISARSHPDLMVLERFTEDGKPRKVFIYNICDHQACYREVLSQAISYTTGVPAMIGAKMMLEGKWNAPGVWNMEQMDPDPFMEDMNKYGLPWQVIEEPQFNLV